MTTNCVETQYGYLAKYWNYQVFYGEYIGEGEFTFIILKDS